MKILFSIFGIMLFFTGCLKTRNELQEVEQRQVMQQQVVSLQRSNADAGSRVTELEEVIRELNGRIDAFEVRLGKNNESIEENLKTSRQQNQELNEKITALQEALTKIEKDLGSFNESTSNSEKSSALGAVKKLDAYEMAQSFFEKKDWKQAILNYQKYRDEFPKGGKFSEATYKIGVAFQELGMKEEAKTFFDEVLTKFPKSKEAQRAKTHLQALKK
jgi:TolA-binding protein